MLGDLSHVEKIYIRTGYTDMRKQLNGLFDIIQYNFKMDPYSNTLFLFCGRCADRIKAVHYEGDGFCLYTSVLRADVFNGPGLVKKPGRYHSSSSAGCWKD